MGHHHRVPRPGAHDALSVIAAYGNRPGIDFTTGRAAVGRSGKNWLLCHDGFFLSVIAGHMTHCYPKPALTPPSADFPPLRDEHTPFYYRGPYLGVEMAFPSARPEPWPIWEYFASDEQDWRCIYSGVPVVLVRHLLRQHGGIRSASTIRPDISAEDRATAAEIYAVERSIRRGGHPALSTVDA